MSKLIFIGTLIISIVYAILGFLLEAHLGLNGGTDQYLISFILFVFGTICTAAFYVKENKK